MTNGNGFLDEVYKELCTSKELMKVLGNPKSAKERNEKIHRLRTPLDYAVAENLNFISIHISSATVTENRYVSRAFLHIDYYAKSRTDAVKMQNIVRVIMNDKFNIESESGYDAGSYTKGIVHFHDTYRPLIHNNF